MCACWNISFALLLSRSLGFDHVHCLNILQRNSVLLWKRKREECMLCHHITVRTDWDNVDYHYIKNLLVNLHKVLWERWSNKTHFWHKILNFCTKLNPFTVRFSNANVHMCRKRILQTNHTICYICNMGKSDLPDMYAWARGCAAPEGECGHIRQITTTHVTYVM